MKTTQQAGQHGPPKAGAAPLFIVGFQRSGTTMLRLMLNSHSRIAVPFESDFIPTTHRNLSRYGDLADEANVRRVLDDICANSFVSKGKLIPDPQAVLARGPRSYAQLVDAIFGAYAHRHGKTRWGDKDPDNLCSMDLLWRLFPGCHFIHIVRDGRDVALSMRGIDWGTRNLPRLAHRWACHTVAARRMGGILGERHYLELPYESLVREPEVELARVCRFLGEDFEPAMLEYHLDSERWIPAGSIRYHTNSIKAPQPQMAEQWRSRMSPADVAIFDQYGGEALEEFGYERRSKSSRMAMGARSAYYAFVARW